MSVAAAVSRGSRDDDLKVGEFSREDRPPQLPALDSGVPEFASIVARGAGSW